MPELAVTLLTPEEVCVKLGLRLPDGTPNLRQLRRVAAQRDFPRPIRLSPRVARYAAAELDAWLTTRGHQPVPLAAAPEPSLVLRHRKPKAPAPKSPSRRAPAPSED